MSVNSGANPSAVIETQHHPRLYFPDGDVVLSASNPRRTNVVLLMRVHRLMLSHHSVVFSDMFSLPPVPEINDMYDGAPLVRMPDAAEDLAKVVEALYDIRFALSSWNDDPSAHQTHLDSTLRLPRDSPDLDFCVRGPLTLATKYQIDSLRKHIVQHIEADWPKSLEEWFYFRKALESKKFWLKSADHLAGTPLPFAFADPASAIRLATQFNIPSILPAAFYRLAITDVEHDSSIAADDPREIAADYDCLERQDLLRLLRGRTTLIQDYSTVSLLLSPYGVARHEQCETSRKCKAAKEKLAEEHAQAFKIEYARRPDILGLVFDMLESDKCYGDVCAHCCQSMDKALWKLLERLWDKLPETFTLD